MELGEPLMVLEFRLNLEDFLETVEMRETRSRKLTRMTLTIAGLVLVVTLFGVPVVIKDVPGALAAFLLGVLPLGVLMVILPWYYKPKRFYRSYFRSNVFSHCRTEIAEKGIRLALKRKCPFVEGV